MSTATKRLPDPTVLRGIPYDTYLVIRDHPDNQGYRMTYIDGTLEIMSPRFRHEKGGDRLGMIVRAYAAVLGVDCQGARSTTFRRGLPGELKGKGNSAFWTRPLSGARLPGTTGCEGGSVPRCGTRTVRTPAVVRVTSPERTRSCKSPR